MARFPPKDQFMAAMSQIYDRMRTQNAHTVVTTLDGVAAPKPGFPPEIIGDVFAVQMSSDEKIIKAMKAQYHRMKGGIILPNGR